MGNVGRLAEAINSVNSHPELTEKMGRRGEFRIATCSMDWAGILQAITLVPPKVALLSLQPSLSRAEGMSTLRRFHLSHPEVIKILMVESSDRELVVGGFRSGARGVFCITEASLRSLCKCIHRVSNGQVWANSEQLNHLLDLIAEVPSLRVFNSQGDQLLTPREEQVVALIAQGLGNRNIAQELNLSEHTIKKYLFRIFDKLGTSTRVELVLYAVNHGNPRHAEWLAASHHELPIA
jgi:DNA-binding NarL/FixJ family response regulator